MCSDPTPALAYRVPEGLDGTRDGLTTFVQTEREKTVELQMCDTQMSQPGSDPEDRLPLYCSRCSRIGSDSQSPATGNVSTRFLVVATAQGLVQEELTP